MKRVVGTILLALGVSTFALASAAVPEVDAGSCGSALALISGALLLVRGRRRS
jgi:hypothetical protein